MRRECREHFPRHRLQRKPQVSDPDMYHSTCVTPVPWCMSRSLTRGREENVPGIPGACNLTYLARGWWWRASACLPFQSIVSWQCCICRLLFINEIINKIPSKRLPKKRAIRKTCWVNKIWITTTALFQSIHQDRHRHGKHRLNDVETQMKRCWKQRTR